MGAAMQMRSGRWRALIVALLAATPTNAVFAGCSSDLAAYNALAGTYRAKLKEHDRLESEPVKQCAVGGEIRPLLERMKSAANKLRKCKIKGGMEPPSYYDGMISLAEVVFEAGCPGKGLEKCPQYVTDVDDHIEELFKPFSEDDVENATDEAICAQGKALDDLLLKADRAVSAVKDKCKPYLESDDDWLAEADWSLVELTEQSLILHRSQAELYRSKCK